MVLQQCTHFMCLSCWAGRPARGLETHLLSCHEAHHHLYSIVTCLLFRIFPLKYLFSNFEKLAYKVPPFSIAIFYFWWSLAQANPLHHFSSPHSYWNLLAPRTTPTTFISCVQLSSHSSFLMSFPSCGQLSSFLASIHTQSHIT